MKEHEVIEYLKQFAPDSPVGFVIVNRERREMYPAENVFGVLDEEHPVFLIEVGEPEDMEEESE